MIFVCLIAVTSADEKTHALDNKEYLFEKLFKVFKIVSVDPHKIGVLLPLTEENARYGNRALDAILLGAGIFDGTGNSPYQFIIEDTRSSLETARKAVKKLAETDGVICIIGPLRGAEDEGAALEAQRLKTPMVTLTSKKGITSVGEYVFRNYLTNKMQIKTLVKYAVNDLKSNRFAVLFPQSPYGQAMGDLFMNEVLRLGGEIVKIQSYEASQTNFEREIDTITDAKKKLNEQGEEVVARTIHFDTLFIPDSYINVRMIASQLAFYDVKGFQLLGTSAWNHHDLLRIGGDYLEGAVFVDGFFLNSFYPVVNDFTDMYYAAFGREPALIDAMAFDTIKIVTKILAERYIDTRGTFRDELLALKDYNGVTGNTSFFNGRDADKEAFILSVRNGRIIQIR